MFSPTDKRNFALEFDFNLPGFPNVRHLNRELGLICQY